MKKALLLSAMMLAVAAGAASAQGINLNWNDCTLGAPVSNLVETCGSNFGSPNKLIVSVDPGGVINNVNGAQGVIDIQVAGGSLPDYWRLDGGGCRAGRLSADVAVGSGNAPFSCPEPWASGGGNQAGGANFVPFGSGPDRGRITWIVAIPGLTTLDSNIAPDWYIIALNLLKTGTTTCSGCNLQACLAANQVRLTKPAQTPGGDVFIEGPALAQHVTFQGTAPVACPGATPSQTSTWGQVKSLYR